MMARDATMPLPAAQRARHLLALAGLFWGVAAFLFLSLPDGFPS